MKECVHCGVTVDDDDDVEIVVDDHGNDVVFCELCYMYKSDIKDAQQTYNELMEESRVALERLFVCMNVFESRNKKHK